MEGGDAADRGEVGTGGGVCVGGNHNKDPGKEEKHAQASPLHPVSWGIIKGVDDLTPTPVCIQEGSHVLVGHWKPRHNLLKCHSSPQRIYHHHTCRVRKHFHLFTSFPPPSI